MMDAMKNLVAIAVLTLLVTLSSRPQTPNGCPTVEVVGPSGITKVGDGMFFRANVSGTGADKLKTFEWKVSGGVITDGQGTDQIRATSAVDGINITATVTVKSTEPSCEVTGSETAPVMANNLCTMPMDDYGDASWEEEQARLDSLFTDLNRNPDAHAYIEIAVPASESIEKTKKHIIKMVKHFRYRGPELDLGRLRFAVTKAESARNTKLWLIRDDATDPECAEGCTLINAKHLYF